MGLENGIGRRESEGKEKTVRTGTSFNYQYKCANLLQLTWSGEICLSLYHLSNCKVLKYVISSMDKAPIRKHIEVQCSFQELAPTCWLM